MRCPQEGWVDMGAVVLLPGGVRCGVLSAGSGVAPAVVPGPLCTPPEFILEVLKLTTQQDPTRMGRGCLVEEEAGLAREAALSASPALPSWVRGRWRVPCGPHALQLQGQESKPGDAGWDPAHDGGCIERELPPALPFGVGTPSTPDPSTSCCSREERGHSQGRRPETGTEAILAGAMSQASALKSGVLIHGY